MTEQKWDYVGHMKAKSGKECPAFLMQCPICGFEYTRVVGMEKIDGKDGYASETGVRGDVYIIHFQGECGSEFDGYYGFHKGLTFCWSDVVTSCRVDYHQYILSGEWKEKATAAKERAGWRCQVCNRPKGDVILDAHHRTYERLGAELESDITVLCRDCHELYEQNRKQRRSR